MIPLIIIGVMVLVALYIAFAYNKLVKLRNQVEEAWSGISVQLKRRYDLIPNLVNTVKGYKEYEAETLEKVIELRNRAQGVPAGDVEGQAAAENALAGALRTVFAVAEAYPELKANENFRELQKALSDTEDNIQNARRYYNALVRDNNTYVESFPSMFVAQMGNFERFSFFEIEEHESKNVEVKF
jgi:LemA protein